MATGLKQQVDRRRDTRLKPDDINFRQPALLRPGQEVEVINLSARGALLQSPSRMKPGARAELQLFGHHLRRHVSGRIARCRVFRLAPLSYEGAIVFDDCLDLGIEPHGTGSWCP